MSWNSSIETGVKDKYCSDCVHFENCYIFKTSHNIGTLLSSIEKIPDGPYVSGQAVLYCNTFKLAEKGVST